MSEKTEEPIDYHIGVDYAKIRKIIREEIQKAFKEYLKIEIGDHS